MLVGTVVQNGHLSTRRLRQRDWKFEASLGYLASEFKLAGGTYRELSPPKNERKEGGREDKREGGETKSGFALCCSAPEFWDVCPTVRQVHI